MSRSCDQAFEAVESSSLPVARFMRAVQVVTARSHPRKVGGDQQHQTEGHLCSSRPGIQAGEDEMVQFRDVAIASPQLPRRREVTDFRGGQLWGNGLRIAGSTGLSREELMRSETSIHSIG